MATRMQQRRGTAAQWISTNSGNGPILAAGEIGFESDTNKFKVGDGVNHWVNLTYFTDAASITAALNTIIDGAPAALNTLNELAAALGDDANFLANLATQTYVDTAVANSTFDASQAAGYGLDWNATTDQFDVDDEVFTTKLYVDTLSLAHLEDTTNVHGIENTANLATKTYADDAASTAVSTHSADTTSVHGIADTAELATKNYTDTAVSTHSGDSTDVHGIANTADLATKSYADTAVQNHAAVTTNVHGIADTDALATKSYADTAVSTHNSDTTDIHGIADTSLLVTTTGTQTLTNKTLAAPTITIPSSTTTLYSAPAEAVFGICNSVADPAYIALADDQIQAVGWSLDASVYVGKTLVISGASNAAYNGSYTITSATYFPDADEMRFYSTLAASKPYGQIGRPAYAIQQTVAAKTISATEIGYVDGVTSAIQTQIDAKATPADISAHASDTTSIHGISDTSQLAYKNAANQTFTGNMEVDGNLVVDGDFTVNGTNFSASATSIVIEDNMLQLAHQNAANTVDLGIVVAYNDGTAKHSGIVRDVSANEWKLFKGVTTEPSTTVDFTQGSLDDLELNNLIAAGIVFTDGTQTKEGVVSRTPIIQKTASYTLSALTERDSLIEVNAASGVTISIPTDATINYPIGTSIDILQTGSGQVTIGAVTPGTTAVNATPGLKLRTQWSSATLFKRAANTWVVMGDLSA